MCHLFKKNTAWLFANSNQTLYPAQLNQLNQWADEIKAGKPLAYITREKAFWTLKLKVNEHTLIPRPETELIIETVEQSVNLPKKILDLGTGSGAIALALATLFPKAKITASDISKDALSVARENAKINHIYHVDFIQSDWFTNIDDKDFDLIVSNPPYIAADDEHLANLKYEPITALVANNNGLADYQAICASAKKHLKPDGILLFEHGWQQHQAVADILLQNNFSEILSAKDLSGHIRITWGTFKT